MAVAGLWDKLPHDPAFATLRSYYLLYDAGVRPREKSGDMDEQQEGQPNIADEAAGQDGGVVAAKRQRVGEIGQHDRPARPPGPPHPLAEGDRDDDEEIDRRTRYVVRGWSRMCYSIPERWEP